MPDETPEQGTEPIVAETKETETPKVPTIEELTKQVAELTKLDETRKNEIAGLNRANTEGATKYNELLKSTETDKQTKEREQAERLALEETERTARLKEKSDTIAEINQLKIEKEAALLGYNKEDLELLNFKSPEDVLNHHKWQEARDLKTKEETAKNILDNNSGKPENYDNKTESGLSDAEKRQANRF